jgi:membrane protein implicated in regulation of membrane protease activity
MYLVAIGWLYVALMMALVEATSASGSILGAVFTFLMYGLAPVSLVLYVLGTPARKAKLRAQALAELEQANEGSHAPAALPVAPKREEL